MKQEKKHKNVGIDPTQEGFEISEWPFYHLARLTSLYMQRMDSSLKPLGIDVPRWRVLAILHANGVATITRLSAEAVTKMSTMAKIVQRMTIEELVNVQTSPEDARSTEVVLAPKGEEIFREVQEKVARIGQIAFHNVPGKEIESLNVVSRKIYDNLRL